MKHPDLERESPVELPESIADLTAEECAMMLRRALSRSSTLTTQKDLASVAGIDRRILGAYFTGKHKPRPQNWALVRAALLSRDHGRTARGRRARSKDSRAEREAFRMKALATLLQDELAYFRTATPHARRILAEALPGPEAGRLAALLVALYDEDQLAAFDAFTASSGE